MYEKDCKIEALNKKVDAIEAIQTKKDDLIQDLEKRLSLTQTVINKNKVVHFEISAPDQF